MAKKDLSEKMQADHQDRRLTAQFMPVSLARKSLNMTDPMLAREAFGVKLRNSKRKQILDAKRMKLTKRKNESNANLMFNLLR